MHCQCLLVREGVPKINRQGKGDEYVKINIVTPSQFIREQKQLIEERGEEGL